MGTNTTLNLVSTLDYSEIYCKNCKKVLGRYNRKFYTEDKIGELLKTSHLVHVKKGHQIEIRVMKKPA